MTWKVDWSKDKTVCSCNAPVYSGIPCVHIVLFAMDEHKKIPLECFNPRFYYENCRVPEAAPAVDELANTLPETEGEDYDGAEETSETIEEEEDYKDCTLELENPNEIRQYHKLYNLAASLTEFYASPKLTEKAKEIESWLSNASDGLVLACIPSVTSEVHSEAERPKAIVGVTVKPASVEQKRVCDDLHIDEATMDSTYSSDEMCDFRGKLRAVIIKIILVYRASPEMVTRFLEQMERKINELKQNLAEVSPETTQTAGLRPVYGALHSDSYNTVPVRVSAYCRAALVKASNNGADTSLLLEASNSSPSKRTGKHKKSVAHHKKTSIGPRVRIRSSRYMFV